VLLQHEGQCDPVKALIFCSDICEQRLAHRNILFQDDYKNHKGIDALPFSRLTRTIPKPLGPKYLESPVTLGEKLRNRRLELHLLQKDVAGRLGVTEDSITNWELNRHEPHIMHYPKIIEFLGYIPFEIDTSTLGGKIKRYRYLKGISQEQLAKELGVDESTVNHYERNNKKPLRKTMAKLAPILQTIK